MKQHVTGAGRAVGHVLDRSQGRMARCLDASVAEVYTAPPARRKPRVRVRLETESEVKRSMDRGSVARDNHP